MTNEEARAYFIDNNEKIISVAKDENTYNYETQQVEDVFMRRTFEANELAIKSLDQKPKSEWQQDHEILKAYSNGANDILDNIGAEIEEMSKTYPFDNHIDMYVKVDDIKKILDKYKSEESEDK